jgi:hypothetical protein
VVLGRQAIAGAARAVLVALGILLAGAAAAQPARQKIDPTTSRLDLGLTVATHGAEAELNLTFRPAEGTEVGRIEAEVRFDPDRMRFFAARPSKMPGVRVTAALQPRKADAAAAEPEVLTIVAESSDRPIPAGVLTGLVFHVAKEASDFDAIEVRLGGRLWAHQDRSKEITAVKMYDGRVTVQEAETFFACFFYMH